MGRNLSYITARTARSRLNDVLGPENWSCKVEPAERWVKCAIKITIPGPEVITVTREAIGGYPDMPSEEDRVKGGDSDAFKRCCAMFGIGEYLYGDDDSHDHTRGEVPGRTQNVSPNSPPPTKQQVSGWFDKSKEMKDQRESSTQGRGWPKHGRQLFSWLKGIEKDYRWPDVIEVVNQNFGLGSNYGFVGKIIDWDEDQADAVATFVIHECAKKDSYRGEFDAKIGAKR